MKKSAGILALVKPQFEVGKRNIGKGGVVRNPDLHAEVIENLTGFFTKKYLFIDWVIPSPILGPKGNKEFFMSLKFES